MFSLENFSFHSNKLIQSQAPEENLDRIIEIQNGRIKNYISESQNRRPYHPWKDWRYLGMLFLEYFIFRLGNFLYLISFIIILAFDDQETTIIPSILIFIFFPFYLLKRLMLDNSRINTLLKESYRKTKKIVFGSTNFYRDCTWGDLSVGEIILIKRNEIFPADVLILDSENEECLLETRLVEGNSLPTRKKPIKLTKVSKYSPFKGNLQEYGKILTGKFQYDPPSSDLTSFKGTLKLKKDPISEELTIQNFGIKGSKLTFTDWVFGIVVYVGCDSKSSHGETKFSAYQNDFINQFFNKLNLMTLILIIIACLVCILRISSNNETFHQIFKENSMEFLFANFVALIPTNIQTLIESLTFLFKYLLEKKHKSSLLIYSPFKIPYLSQVTHLIMDKGPCLDDSGTAIYSLYLPKTKNFFITPAFFEKERRNTKRGVDEKKQMSVVQTQNLEGMPAVSRVVPKILLPRKDSVPNEGLCSPMPIKVQYKFSPYEKYSEEQFFQEDTRENFFSGADHRNLNPIKEMETLIFDFKKDSNNQSTINDISSDLKYKLSGNDMNELEKMGNFSEILGNTNNIPPKFNEIFLALLLCHEIRSKEDVKDSKLTSRVNDDDHLMINEFLLPDSNTLLKFSEEYKYKFKYQSRIFNKINIYTLSINGQQVQYYILGSELSHPDSESKHYRFTILVKSVGFPDDSSNCKVMTDLPVIYIRTDDITFLDFLDMEESEREILKLKMEILKTRGMRFSIICKKKINSDEEVTSYLNYIRNPKKTFNFENCELLTVVAIKDKIIKGLRLLVNDFLTIENKAWLLSNDSEDLVISTGYLLGLLSKDCEIIRLDLPEDSKFCGINEAWIKMRSALTKIKKILLSKGPQIHSSNFINHRRLPSLITKSPIQITNMKYAVVLNRKTLEIIAKDQDLLSHFVFIANFSRSLIGYQLNPQDKAFLVRLIREHFPKKPVIMSIGDGLDDNQMSKNAHIAVNMMPNDYKVRNSNSPSLFSNFAPNTDILINNYALLRMMMRVNSLTFLSKIFHITLICYSVSFLYVLPFAWYSLFFGVLTNQFISGALFVVRDGFVLNSISILYFFWGVKFSSLILKGFVWVYHDGRYIKEQIYRIAFWLVFINGVFDSLIITLMIIYGVDYSVSGNILVFDEVSSLMQLAVYFIAFFKMTFFFKKPLTMFILLGSIAILSSLLISLMIDMTKNKTFGWSMLNGMAEISKQKELLLLLLYIVLYMLMRVLTSQNIFYKTLFVGNYGKIQNYIIKNGIQSIKENNITKLVKSNLRELNLKNINDSIRKIFKNKNMDIIIQDMLNPNEINANESGYHRLTLKFKDSELESQYRSQIIKFSIGKRKKITSIALVMLMLADIGLLVLSYKEKESSHANVALSCTIYTFLLLFNRIILKIKNFKYYHILPRLLAPAITFILNITLIILSQDSSFDSLISIYILILSIIFHSEYSEVFIYYFIYSLLLFVLFLVKVCITKGPQIFIISDAFPLSFETPQKVSLILEGLIIVFYEIYGKYKKEQTYRNIFLNERDIKKENKKIGELLSILVPPFMKESLIQGVHSLSEDQGNVTILFCDICDFDKIIKQEQKGVIKILDNLFRMFDTFCVENDVQKIETVGKTYMACAGLKAVESTLQTVNNKNSTQRVINLALNMMSYTKKFTYGDNCKLCIKIGIHFGQVIAGVIGYHKPQFSLIGDTVNTASRVCSTGEEGVITISKEGFDNIQGKFHSLEYTEKLAEAKGKGIIITYQIRKKKNTEEHHNTNFLEIKEKEKKQKVIKPIHVDSTEGNLELLNIAINLKKNIKNCQYTNGLGKTIESNSPRFLNNKPFSATFKVKDNSSDSPRSAKKYNFQNSLENKSDLISFTRMFSDLKCVNCDENYSNYEKRESFLKLQSTVSKTDQFNLLLYIENEHLQALKNNDNLPIDKIDKVEKVPGQFNLNKNEAGKRLTNCNNLNDDDFFDKLKIEDNSLELLNFNSHFLTIKNTNPVISKDYIEKQRLNYFKENWASFLVISLIYMINTFLNILKKNDLNNFLVIMLARGIVNSFNFITFVVFRKKNSETRNMRKVFLILTGLTGSELLLEYCITNYTGMENSLEIIIFYMISINFSYFFFSDGIILLIYISVFIVLQILKNPTLEFGIEITLMISSLILIVKNLHVKLLSDFKNFNTLRVNNFKKKQQNNLIVNLLPSHILEKFLRNPNQKLNLTDDFENVTILFADIAGFTKYSSSVTPTQVVALLKDLFTEFDKLCLENCVYKLYTIGDCYVVLGVIDAEERNYEREALNVVNMGFQMIEKIKEVKKRVSFHDIDMRIGIHTGKIIGGIIGTDIVRYDVYGMDVVIANKMESNGIEGNVCVSERTREILLKSCMDDFVFEYHKDVQLQSFNQTIKCYKVIDIRNE